MNGKLNYKAVVSFCLKLEVLIQDLIDLAEAEGSEQLKFDVYSSTVRATIQNLFELKEMKKLRCMTGRGKEGLEEHITFIKDHRVKAQKMVDPVEVKERFKKNDLKSTDGNKSKSTHNLFKKPRKKEDCRICATLETEGCTDTDLYEDHICDEVIGCPKFQAMCIEDRRKICLKAKFCLKCCDKDVVFGTHHSRSCTVNKSHKISITCVKHPRCTTHSWLCSYHKDDNKSKISELGKKLKISPPVNTNVVHPNEPNLHTVLESSPDLDSALNVVKPNEVGKAIKNMRRNTKKKGAELYDIPEGN